MSPTAAGATGGSRPARRGVLAAALGMAALTACSSESDRDGRPHAGPVAGSEVSVDPHGTTQAGVHRPVVQQRFTQLSVLDLAPAADPVRLLAGLGERIGTLVAGRTAGLPEPGDLTVTVGVGPRVAAHTLGTAALAPLPRFRRDRFDARHAGGDLLVQVSASEPSVVVGADSALSGHLAGDVTRRWSELGFRGTADDRGVSRNVLGFHDGIIQPHTDRDLEESVWLAPPGSAAPQAGSTIAVVRRIVLDVDRFESLPVAHQEAVVGRARSSGVPLSGGTLTSQADLGAKRPDGSYVVPAGAHVRRAHPSATGRPLMLRRGYSFASAGERGLLFVSFQRTLESFVQTHYRLDEGDDLMAFASTTASGVFWILPGFTAETPLGASLRA